jgi:hypothetical protein
MKKEFFNGFKSKADLEDAIQAFSHLASYFPVYEPCDDGYCRLESQRSFRVHKGESILCCEDGVECIALVVHYGMRAVCLLEVMIPDFENDAIFQWTPQVLCKNAFIKGVDYNELLNDFHNTANKYIGEKWLEEDEEWVDDESHRDVLHKS